ncbi:bZIP transcription factor [Aspergillus terreus]|uniref:BZIP transcription factor n=1 Tax=Aspergillus terreus TaxID=33178 RepID=A0A5M3YTB5_ASPTE|nr:hypothetical protein ATETN484_0004008000 [Aspergillus terreus]GFF12970.1 bZIP transcription factor [Aspergillus terreus]
MNNFPFHHGDMDNFHFLVRNGQPTPPPFDEQRASVASSFQYPALSPENYSPPDSAIGATGSSGGRRRKIEDTDGGADEETAKRRRFLERNRLAASKCRQKKKMEAQMLEQRCEKETKRRLSLNRQVRDQREELIDLKGLLLAHAGCGNPAIDRYLARMVATIAPIKDHGDSDKEDSPPTIDVPAADPDMSSQSLSFGFDGSQSPVPPSDSIEPSSADLTPRTGDDSDSSYFNDPSFMFDPHDTTFDDFIYQDE